MPAYDYTKEPIPFDGENADDFEIGSDVANVSDRDAARIELENVRRHVPPGRHLLIVAGFRDAPQIDSFRVQLNGRTVSFDAYRVKVRFCLPSDPVATVEDNFLLPPDNPAHLPAYFNGMEPEGSKAGFQANKFIHFIDRLGYPFPPGGKLPEAARRLSNWKGRPIVAEVISGKPYVDRKTGETKQGYPQIKLFSYEVAPKGGAAAMKASESVPQSVYQQPTQPRRATGVGSETGRPAGLDDV